VTTAAGDSEAPGLLVARSGIEPPTYRFFRRSLVPTELAGRRCRPKRMRDGRTRRANRRPPAPAPACAPGRAAPCRRVAPCHVAGSRWTARPGQHSLLPLDETLLGADLGEVPVPPDFGPLGLARQLREPRRRDGGGSAGDAMTRRRSLIPRICGDGAPCCLVSSNGLRWTLLGWSNSSAARRYQHMTAVILQDAVGFLAEADLMTACLAWDARAVSTSKAPSRRL
jgi:hypothetical protein